MLDGYENKRFMKRKYMKEKRMAEKKKDQNMWIKKSGEIKKEKKKKTYNRHNPQNSSRKGTFKKSTLVML